MNTGYLDPNKVRMYESVWGKEYITFNQSWFDGDNIGWTMVNPYRDKV